MIIEYTNKIKYFYFDLLWLSRHLDLDMGLVEHWVAMDFMLPASWTGNGNKPICLSALLNRN